VVVRPNLSGGGASRLLGASGAVDSYSTEVLLGMTRFEREVEAQELL